MAWDRVLEVLDMAYGAALEPARWNDVLEKFSDLVGGSGAAITYQNQLTGRGQGITARLDPEVHSLYFGHFAHRNPIQQRNDVAAMQEERWRPRIIHDEHHLPKEELVRSEYYNDFMRRFDMHSCLMVGLAQRNMNVGVLTVMRPARKDQFGSREFALTTTLHPHLVRAFDLGLKLSGLQQCNNGFADVLELSHAAVFLLDRDGLLTYANSAGETLLASGRGLTLKSCALHACQTDADRRLKAAIAAAADPDREHRRGGSVTIPLPECKMPLSVLVAPVRAERFSLFGNGPSVLVLVNDPADRIGLPESRLKDLYGLTHAETRVAIHLMSGSDTKAIAKGLRVSIHTVRMHIARIMAKTDTNRQAELVGLLLRTTMAN